MIYSTLHILFRGYALQIATDILNIVLSKFILKTPLELWCGRKPSLRHYRKWGCSAYVLNRRNTKKLDSRTEVCLFIGYPKGTKGGIFYNLRDKKAFVSTDVTFLENKYMNNFKPRSKLLVNEISENKTLDDSTRVVEKGANSLTTRVVDIENEAKNIIDKPS